VEPPQQFLQDVEGALRDFAGFSLDFGEDFEPGFSVSV
jgi:hypothetical protein